MSQFDEFDQQGKAPARNTGAIISHAFEMYKGVFLYGLVVMIIYFVADFILQLITGFSLWTDFDSFNDFDDAESRLWRNSEVKFYYSSTGLLNIALTPLYLGLIYVTNKFNNKQQIDFNDLFIGYRQNLGQTMLYGLITTIILYISLAMCGFPFLFVFPLFLLGLPSLLFENLSATEALGKTFNIAKEDYGVFLGVSLLGGLLSIAGFILCCIGIVFTIPFIYVVMYSAYCAYCGKPRQI
ncbi:beta-carotene 15,15'-monooxygenase [Chryseobacterium foetidum]|uniref:beta-carotene 15,15'-monooxygenase n=1 Tax=Chryseobacterium foetidum TaxID=2951057 RepID=UPI0021CA21E2|nr:beta-carotene 15,15'-monooxygenase [Chryseobacterium foetidum]